MNTAIKSTAHAAAAVLALAALSKTGKAETMSAQMEGSLDDRITLPNGREETTYSVSFSVDIDVDFDPWYYHSVSGVEYFDLSDSTYVYGETWNEDGSWTSCAYEIEYYASLQVSYRANVDRIWPQEHRYGYTVYSECTVDARMHGNVFKSTFYCTDDEEDIDISCAYVGTIGGANKNSEIFVDDYTYSNC